MRLPARLISVLAVVAVACAAAGCGVRADYGRAEREQTLSQIESEAASFDHSRWATVGSDRAAEMRSQSLASLRRMDTTAATLAEVLTRDFHASRGVPVRIRETIVEGKPAWTVIEVYGPNGGSLDRWRLWVLTRPAGGVISSSTYR